MLLSWLNDAFARITISRERRAAAYPVVFDWHTALLELRDGNAIVRPVYKPALDTKTDPPTGVWMPVADRLIDPAQHGDMAIVMDDVLSTQWRLATKHERGC